MMHNISQGNKSALSLLRVTAMSIMLHVLMNYTQLFKTLQLAWSRKQTQPGQKGDCTYPPAHLRNAWRSLTQIWISCRAIEPFLFLYKVPVSDDGCLADLCFWKQISLRVIYSGTVTLNICLRTISREVEDVNKQTVIVTSILHWSHEFWLQLKHICISFSTFCVFEVTGLTQNKITSFFL